MKKILFNLYLIVTNINNYGLFLLFKTIFYELFYITKFLDFRSYLYSDNKKKDYLKTKTSDRYSTPAIPTPYYFLKYIKDYFIKEKINDFTLIDLGCGSGRVGVYLSYFLKIKFFGIDNNEILINSNKKKFKDKDNFNFYYLNLQDIKSVNKFNLNQFLDSKQKVLFVSDPFDKYSIMQLIKYYKEFFNFYFVMINQKDLNYFSDLNCIYKIYFKNQKRNIQIFKI